MTMRTRISRLGFPVKVMVREDLKSNDTRRSASNPHLKVSLEYVDAILDHLVKHRINMYRMSSDLAPYATHPDMPQFHQMVQESKAELEALGRKAKALDMRLSFHPSQFVVLNSPDQALVDKSIWDLVSQAEMLDLMELGPEAVMVIHVGGTYGDVESSRARWVETWNRLPEPVRRRLVLEHDDLRFSAADTLWIHEHTGVRLIFDHQHFWCLNPERADLRETFKKFMATWPEGQQPKIHFSSPRTELREKVTVDKKTRKKTTKLVPPVFTGHADFCSPFEFATFMRTVHDQDFDVMLEAKVKDLALLRLRSDLLRYAPDVASRFDLHPEDAAVSELEEEIAPDDEVLQQDDGTATPPPKQAGGRSAHPAH
jgi:UV DNA damage endonuclease